jgi:hypothetical protein
MVAQYTLFQDPILETTNEEFKKDYPDLELEKTQGIDALPEYTIELQKEEIAESTILPPIDALKLTRSKAITSTTFKNNDTVERSEVPGNLATKLTNPIEKAEAGYGNVTMGSMDYTNSTLLSVGMSSVNTGPKINSDVSVSSVTDPFERDVVKTAEAALKAGNLADSRPDSFSKDTTQPDKKRKATIDLARPKKDKKTKLPLIAAGVGGVAAIGALMLL